MHIPQHTDIPQRGNDDLCGCGTLPSVIYQTLLPSHLYRNEITIFKNMVQSLRKLSCLRGIMVASTSLDTLAKIADIEPDAQLIRFVRLPPKKFRGSKLRRLEIIPGKETLRAHAAEYPDKLFFYNDADQWISLGTVCRAIKLATAHDIVRIPTPKRSKRPKTTIKSASFNCYITTGEILARKSIIDATMVMDAQEGKLEKLYPPDAQLLHHIRKNKDVVWCPHSHAQHYGPRIMWEMIDSDFIIFHDKWNEGTL